MDIIQSIHQWLEAIATTVPLELFVFGFLLIEEFFPPIPATLVITTASSLAVAQNHTILYLIWLSFWGAVGKTIGSYGVYVLSDKLEDVVMNKTGKLFGITHTQLEAIGKRFNKSWKDDVTLFILRVLPLVPSTPTSIVCGVIKLNMWTFLQATFLGSFVKFFYFFTLSYAGISRFLIASQAGVSGQTTVTAAIFGVVFLILAATTIWWVKRHKA